MDRVTLLKKLDALLAEWETHRRWGAIEIEVTQGAIVFIRQEVKEKFTVPNGGYARDTRRENR